MRSVLRTVRWTVRSGKPDRAPPRIAASFFLSTRSAAVSAKARSLRANSRSSSLIRFLSSLVAWLSLAVLAPIPILAQSFACAHAPRMP